jgi:HlyD family secretion protein
MPENSPRPVAAAKGATRLVFLLACLFLGACADDAPQVLGTLEYDRVSLPAPAAERIVSIAVREGDRVAAGAVLLSLEKTRTEAQADAARADAQRQREALAELEAGTRDEQLAQARAQLEAAQAQARDARAYHQRLQPLGQRKLVAAADVDRALAATRSADAQVMAARARLDELVHGARVEAVAQARAGVGAADARSLAQQVTLDKLIVTAPRAGRIDSLPYKLGDQAPVGAPLAILLVGDAPHARVYVPEPMRASVKVGDRATVHVDGHERSYPGRVRAIRSEPVFTPYYALSGKDASRLSYLAEVALDGRPDLPAGLPARVEFVAAGRTED